MAARIRRPAGDTPAGPELGYISCSFGAGRSSRPDPRLEQDLDAMLEADVEFFDHPTLGRVRVRDLLVMPPAATIEAEQDADEFP